MDTSVDQQDIPSVSDDPAQDGAAPAGETSRGVREVLVVAHPRRPFVRDSAQRVLDQLTAAGIRPRVLGDEAGQLDLSCAAVVDADAGAAAGVELVLVLGGDGSLLRGADLARSADAPLLGVNLGHIGFLAEAESEDLDDTVAAVIARDYTVEERMTLDVTIRKGQELLGRNWALNEMALEKGQPGKLLDVVVEIEGRPLSRWSCDGAVCATPTGSTAYAFSAGGPVVWPSVEALLVVPLSAHALFARPLVVGPDVMVAFEVLGKEKAVLSCDGRRPSDVLPGSRVEVTRGAHPVRLARVRPNPFTDRLVAKFELPVEGWRGRSRPDR
ncbi:MAG: kinase [Frankiaceae bacterium]|nr:kinase [Frankiaceae bacterium]MDQ1648895.1 kinase [Frankiaceae bacterium]